VYYVGHFSVSHHETRFLICSLCVQRNLPLPTPGAWRMVSRMCSISSRVLSLRISSRHSSRALALNTSSPACTIWRRTLVHLSGIMQIGSFEPGGYMGAQAPSGFIWSAWGGVVSRLGPVGVGLLRKTKAPRGVTTAILVQPCTDRRDLSLFGTSKRLFLCLPLIRHTIVSALRPCAER
jgi:hypothetical protein